MSKNYVSVRVKAVSTTEAKHQVNHDTRKKCPGYVELPDTTTYLFCDGTSELVEVKNDEATAGIKELLDLSVAAQERKYKKIFKKKRHAGAKPFIEGIITFSDPAVASSEELTRAAEKYVRALCAEHGEANPFYLSRHDDEAKTHFHFLIENMTADGYSVRKKLDRAACRRIQDLASEVFSPLGFERGEKINIPRRYLSVREMRREEIKKFVVEEKNLREQIQDARGVLEGLEASSAALENKIREGVQEISNLQTEIKKRKEARGELLKKIQQEIAGVEQRKREYERYDVETKRLRRELKKKQQEIEGEKDFLKQLKALSRAKAEPETNRVYREEDLRDVLRYLISNSTLSDTQKEQLRSAGFGVKWPSAIDAYTLEKTAGEMNQTLEKSGQEIQR